MHRYREPGAGGDGSHGCWWLSTEFGCEELGCVLGMTTSEGEDGHGERERPPAPGAVGGTVSLRDAARLQSTEEDHASRMETPHLPDKGHGPEESRGQRWERVTEGGEGLLSLRACGLGLVLFWGPEHKGRNGLPVKGPQDTCLQLEAASSRAERGKTQRRGRRDTE